MHLCPHLAEDPDRDCEFLGHETPYVGRAVVPREKELERIVERRKVERIKERFFGGSGDGNGRGLKEEL